MGNNQKENQHEELILRRAYVRDEICFVIKRGGTF